MAIVKANYTKSNKGAKATIRYIQHRPGKDNAKMTRVLFGWDGIMGRNDAYRIIDDAAKGSLFYRIVLSPDPQAEDSNQDLHLRAITEQTMQTLEDRLQTPVAWVGVVHADHTDVRHVHIVAVVSGRLGKEDFAALRHAATEASLEQRRLRDLQNEQHVADNKRAQYETPGWELAYNI
jgi:hypothetical protein